MKDAIRAICGISVCCGLLMSMIPDSTGKRAFRLCCAVVMMTSILSAIKTFDYESYDLELSRYREMGAVITEDGERQRERLKRNTVEEKCERYLTEAAASIGIKDAEIQVTAEWSVEGFWMPDRVHLKGSWEDEARKHLSDVIEADLGIPKERQAWENNGS